MSTRLSSLSRAHNDRGATDPILVIAGIAITLILLVGGSFAISGFIANAHDTNAKGDLDRIATAEAAFMAENDRFGTLAVGPDVSTEDLSLAQASVGFTPTAGNNTRVRTSPSGWAAVTKSGSGKVFFRSSESSAVHEIDMSAELEFGPWTDSSPNYFPNPTGGSAGNFSWFNLNGSTYAGGGAMDASWSESGRANAFIVAAPSTTVPSASARLWVSVTDAMQSLNNQRSTLAIRFHSAQPFTVQAPTMRVNSGHAMAQHAASNAVSVPANTTVTMWTTFTSTYNSGSSTRAEFIIGGMSPGQRIDASNVELYAGDFDPARDMVYPGKPGNETTRYINLMGTSGGSVKQTRTLTLPQPADVRIPSDMSWGDVANDLADVAVAG